jgi:hypothetical protein
MQTMKRATTFILVGIIVVLAAALVGVLVFVKNQPAQERTFQQLVEIAPMESDSELWGQNFPNQWTTLQKTATNNIDTTYAGSSAFPGWSATRARSSCSPDTVSARITTTTAAT